jgi:hypothetical protein
MGTELNRAGQRIGTGNHAIHQLFLLIFDIEVSPDGNTQKQAQADKDEQFGNQAAADFL